MYRNISQYSEKISQYIAIRFSCIVTPQGPSYVCKWQVLELILRTWLYMHTVTLALKVWHGVKVVPILSQGLLLCELFARSNNNKELRSGRIFVMPVPWFWPWIYELASKRKGKISDSVIWQKSPYYQKMKIKGPQKRQQVYKSQLYKGWIWNAKLT